jgi:hypothetical protein
MLLTFAVTGCSSKQPSDFEGTWTFQTQGTREGFMGTDTPIPVVFTLRISKEGKADYSVIERKEESERVQGDWRKVEDFLVINKDNGGFVTLKIVSKSKTEMTLVRRDGFVLKFTRVN